MSKKDELFRIFSMRIRNVLSRVPLDYERLQEVRIRINAPLIIVYDNHEYLISQQSKMLETLSDPYIISKTEIRETIEYISNYSLYAFEDEIRQGFITIQGGHRVGIAGKVIIEDGRIKSMKHISFINVRLSHQVVGCADKIMPYLYSNQGMELNHTLIISPPRCGKTTLLRDIIRQISDGDCYHAGQAVGVVDERSEIGACYMGIPQNRLGIRTDILDCCPKAEGMMMLIRSMSPSVIAVDEIGSVEEMKAIEYVMNCGCKLIATVHGSSVSDIRKKPVLGRLVEEQVFDRYLVLSGKQAVGTVEGIYDREGKKIAG